MATIKTTPVGARPGRPKGWKKGAVKYSKMYLQRVDDARALRASIDAFKTDVAEGLGQRLAPELIEGETLPDFSLSLDLLARSVESSLERLRAAEHQLIDRGIELAKVRRESEKLARHEIYPRVVLVRRLIDTQFGKEDGRRVHGMAGKTLRKPRRLHGQLEYLVWALEAGRQEPSKSLFKGLASEREAWMRQLKPGYEQLTALLDDMANLEAIEQLARDTKNEAIRKFDDAYGQARRLLEANFDFAGFSGKLAKLLRSYVHRRRLSQEARRKRQARAEGSVKRTLRAAASSVRGWIGGRPPAVA